MRRRVSYDERLSGLAVNLDDAIDNDESRLFPMIQKTLFGIDYRS